MLCAGKNQSNDLNLSPSVLQVGVVLFYLIEQMPVDVIGRQAAIKAMLETASKSLVKLVQCANELPDPVLPPAWVTKLLTFTPDALATHIASLADCICRLVCHWCICL